jgi:hypothetical protein
MIKSTQSIRISDDRARAVKPSFIYTYIECICVFLLLYEMTDPIVHFSIQEYFI